MKKTHAGLVLAAIAAVAISMAGCRLDSESAKINNSKIIGVAENTLLTCSDGLDNDGDTLVDCDDPDCHDMGTKEVPGPGMTVCPDEENNIYVCSDGKDNDGDGFIDCEDNSCKSTAACCVARGTEGSYETCTDGIDNDCNGYIDCADYACSKSSDPRVVQLCLDLKCPGDVEAEDTFEKCTDGIDNDCNGYIDCADHSCSRSRIPEVAAYCKLVRCPNVNLDENPKEDTLEACSDGIDNDCNGYIDCNDNSCKNSSNSEVQAYCQSVNCPKGSSPENTMEACSDGIDNDCDGKTDCKDPDCKDSTDPEVAAYCRGVNKCPEVSGSENTEETCSDGLDNDCNGYIDCQDRSCRQFKNCRKENHCNEDSSMDIAEGTLETCTDGIDNDCNSYIDCNDRSCQDAMKQEGNSDAVAIKKYCNGPFDFAAPNAVDENTPELCQDGIDNDFNGLADCAEPKCQALALEYCSVPLTREPPPRPANFASLSPAERAVILADEKTICTDGIDNDRNGIKDCDEYQCMLLSLQKLTGDEAKYNFTCQLQTTNGASE